MIGWIHCVAFAQAMPTELSASLETDAEVVAFSQSQSANFVAFLDSAGRLNLLDTRTWDIASTNPSCAVEDVALFENSDESLFLYGACDNGSLVGFSVSEAGSLSAVSGDSWQLEDSDALIGLVATDDGLWAASDDDVGVGLHDYDPESDVAHSKGPYTTGMSGFQKLAVQGEQLVVLHGSDDLTKVSMSTGGAVRNEENLSGRSFVDLVSDGDNLLYLMDSGGGVVRYMSSNNEYQVVLNESDGLEELGAIGMQPDGDEPYLVVFEQEQSALRFYPFTSTAVLSDQVGSVISTDSIEVLLAGESVLFGGGGGVGLRVFSSGPWVELLSKSSSILAEGETVSIEFSSSASADYTLRLKEKDGDVLLSGSVGADETISVELSVTDSFDEGQNRIYLVADGSEGSGHDSLLLTVDNPPSLVELTEKNVGFGDSEIVLNFDGIDDADLSYYQVFYSTTSFEEASLPEDGLLEVTAEPKASVSVQIPNLVNGVEYFVAIRAVDESGMMGPLSAVLSVVPEPAVGAASLAGDAGGCTGLNHGRTNRLAWSAIGFMLGVILMRRKSAC